MQSDRFFPFRRFPRAATISSAILLFLLLAGATAHFWYRQQLLNEQQTALQAEMALLANSLSAGINRRLMVADGLEALVHADPQLALSQEMFQAFSAGLAASTTGTRTIALAHEGRISHVFPRASNNDLLGYHLLQDAPPAVRQDLERALQDGLSLVQAPVALPGGTPGFTVQRPIFEDDQLWGFVYLSYELQPILRSAGLDGGEAGPLADNSMALYDQHGALIYGSESLRNLQPLSSFVPFVGGSWQLLAVPAGGWAASIRSSLLLFDAFLLTAILLATATAYTFTSRHFNLQDAIRQRTQEISEVNRQLQADIAERQAVEASLRRREAELEEARKWRKRCETLYGKVPQGIHSWMAVPLSAKNRPVGMLSCGHPQPNFYTGHHAAVAAALGNQAAVAVENARLFRAVQRGAEQFRTIADVSRQITAVRALDEVANQAAYLIQQAFGYYHVHIGLIEGEQIIFREATGVWRDERYCIYCGRHKFIVGQSGASGRVAATGDPLLVRDVRRDPYYVPMDEEQVGSALVLPLKVHHNTIGVVNIESDRTNAFDETDVSVLQPLANQLAIALENARLYEQASTLAALQERQKLARELHDSVSQALYGIGLGSRTALKLLETEGVEKEALAAPLEYVLSMANAALAEMRALIFELRPESLASEGLIPALGRRVEVLRARDGLQVETALDEEPELPLNVKEVLYRVAQEALHNVVKHANASNVQVSLSQQGENVVLEICDDGAGFELQAHFPGHLGLQSMRERVEGVGGCFHIESSQGRGTTIRAIVPASDAALLPQPEVDDPERGVPERGDRERDLPLR